MPARNRLTLRPTGPFSLAQAARFGFGPRDADPDGRQLRLAFCVDGFREHAGVVVREDGDALACEIQGATDVDVVGRQVARVLSLDHDGNAWMEVARRDEVVGELQRRYEGLRPVLFHSPYEAAAWSIISTRYARRLATQVRDRIAASLGQEFDLAGERVGAFPCPDRLVELTPVPGLGQQKVERLHELAAAALDGRLDPDRLRAMPPEHAVAEVQRLRGIGPFYANLIVVRGTGVADAPVPDEPRLRQAITHWYGLDHAPGPDEISALAESWRPFRTWAAVLLRVSWEREAAS